MLALCASDSQFGFKHFYFVVFFQEQVLVALPQSFLLCQPFLKLRQFLLCCLGFFVTLFGDVHHLPTGFFLFFDLGFHFPELLLQRLDSQRRFNMGLRVGFVEFLSLAVGRLRRLGRRLLGIQLLLVELIL